MSYTKALRRALRRMTDPEIIAMRDKLNAQLMAEKNPMIRSSLRERVAMCEREIQEGNRPVAN